MYRCSKCGAQMTYPHDRCPACGVLLSGVKCESCGYIAAKSVFIKNNHRCPKCGSIVRSSGGGCFVATAVFDGCYDCPELMKLRYFRDNYLARTRPGRRFIAFYYKRGPIWAEAIKNKPLLKSFLKRLFKFFL